MLGREPQWPRSPPSSVFLARRGIAGCAPAVTKPAWCPLVRCHDQGPAPPATYRDRLLWQGFMRRLNPARRRRAAPRVIKRKMPRLFVTSFRVALITAPSPPSQDQRVRPETPLDPQSATRDLGMVALGLRSVGCVFGAGGADGFGDELVGLGGGVAGF